MFNNLSRRYNYRRNGIRRRKRNLKRTFVRRKPVSQLMTLYKFPNKLSVMSFSRLTSPDTIISEDISDVKLGYSVRLDQLPTYNEITDLFQQYRINKVIMQFMPKTTTRGGIVPSAQTTTPQIYIAYDPNDSSSPGSIDDIRQLQNVRVYSGYRAFRYVFYPKPLVPVFQQGVSSAYANAKNVPWISTDYPAVEHYGVKIAIPASDSTGSFFQSWTIVTRVYFTVRGTK